MHTYGRMIVILAALSLMALAGACGGGGNGGPVVGGRIYFSQDSNTNGLFELNPFTGTASLVGAGRTATSNATIGLTETTDPGALLGSTFSDIAMIEADGSNAVVLPSTAAAEALAMNISTGLLYGCINGAFSQLDPVTGLSLGPLAAPGTDIEGLAADPDNDVIYGISRDTTLLYVYDIGTDAWSTVADTQRSWIDAGLAYDFVAGVLYAIDANTDSLYRINPLTAQTTLVGPLGTEAAGGLAFVAN